MGAGFAPVRRAGFAEGALCGNVGSFIPFAESAADRQASGDPRPSLAERYSSHQAYVAGVAAAAGHLVKDRFLLPADAKRIVERARASRIAVQD